MKIVLAVLLVVAVGVSGVAAQAPQPVNLAFATLDTGSAWYVYGATMAELLRKTLPAGSNIDVKPRAGGVGNPRLVAKNETPLGFAFTVTNRWAIEGKEAYDAEARQPARPGGRPRHLLPGRHRHQEARHRLRAGHQGQEDPGASSTRSRSARWASSPGASSCARTASATPTSRAGAAPPSTSATTSSSTPSRTAAPTCSSRWSRPSTRRSARSCPRWT